MRPPAAPQGTPGRIRPRLDGRVDPPEEWKGAAYLPDLEGTAMQTQDDLPPGGLPGL